MKQTLVIITLLFLLSCGSSSENTDELDISGRWIECREITPLDIAFTEVIYSNASSTFENTVFGSTDNQCINILPNPVFRTNATVILENPRIAGSGLTVYNYTLVNVTRWDNLSNTTTPRPNFYSILYLNGNKLYFGKLTIALDGTSEAKRPDEIDFSIFLTRQ